MVNWMSAEEAMVFFGVGELELTQLVAEYDIDVDLDEHGDILQVNADEVKEPLFREHERKVGHRPDDFRENEKAQKAEEKREEDERRVRRSKKHLLLRRMV